MSKQQYSWMTLKGWQPDGPVETILSQKAISQFCRDFNVAAKSLDPQFGIIRLTLPADAPVHTMMIEPAEAARLAKEFPGKFEGPWDNPQIGLKPNAPRLF
jgi:hypothetical protein